MIRAGLELVGKAGGKSDLIKLLATSNAGAEQMRSLLKGPGLLRSMVLGMVRARNSRLSTETVDKVVDDLLTVLTELAQPVEQMEDRPTDSRGGAP